MVLRMVPMEKLARRRRSIKLLSLRGLKGRVRLQGNWEERWIGDEERQ